MKAFIVTVDSIVWNKILLLTIEENEKKKNFRKEKLKLQLSKKSKKSEKENLNYLVGMFYFLKNISTIDILYNVMHRFCLFLSGNSYY